ncbi:unnamed protein product, partial [Trichobilharzia regenti]
MRGGYREGSMVSSNAYKLSVCKSSRGTSSTNGIEIARQTRFQSRPNHHDEMRDMPTTAKLNKGSVQLEREVELKADAVAEVMDTCKTASVIDQRVAHLSSDANAKPVLR